MKALFIQYFMVAAVFLIMIVVGNYFASRIVYRNLALYGEKVITSSAETLTSYLKGHMSVFEDVVFVVEDAYKRGAGLEAITYELTKWAGHLSEKEGDQYKDYLLIYGVVDGVFIQAV